MSGAHVERQNAQFQVPLQSIGIQNAAVPLGRDGPGQYSLTVPAGATAYVVIPVGNVEPWVVSANASVDRSGFKLEQVLLWYTIQGANLTSQALQLYTENIVGGAARAAPALVGSFAVDNDDGTTSLPITFRATPYRSRAVLSTPQYLLQQGQLPTLEWTLITPAGSTVKIHGVTLVGRVGIYY